MESFKDNEVTDKLKKAIRAKLADMAIDAHDDKLTDFIMVMAMNGKTKESMTCELGVFLQDKTNTFTDWLFEILLKIQFASIPERVKQKRKEKKMKAKEPVTAAVAPVPEAIPMIAVVPQPVQIMVPVLPKQHSSHANTDAPVLKKSKKHSEVASESSKKASSSRKRRSDDVSDASGSKKKSSGHSKEHTSTSGHSKSREQISGHSKSREQISGHSKSRDHAATSGNGKSRDHTATSGNSKSRDHAATSEGSKTGSKSKHEKEEGKIKSARKSAETDHSVERSGEKDKGIERKKSVDRKVEVIKSVDEKADVAAGPTDMKDKEQIPDEQKPEIEKPVVEEIPPAIDVIAAPFRVVEENNETKENVEVSSKPDTKREVIETKVSEPLKEVKKLEAPLVIEAEAVDPDEVDRELLGGGDVERKVEANPSAAVERGSRRISGDRKVELIPKSKSSSRSSKGSSDGRSTSSRRARRQADEFGVIMPPRPQAKDDKVGEKDGRKEESVPDRERRRGDRRDEEGGERDSRAVRVVRVKPRKADDASVGSGDGKPASVVASVIDHGTEENNPSRAGVGKVASAVSSVSRHHSRHTNLPSHPHAPNRNMVFKAVLEAATSVSKTPNLPGNIRGQLVDQKLSVEKLLQRRKLREAATMLATMKQGRDDVTGRAEHAPDSEDTALHTSVNVEELLDMDYDLKNVEDGDIDMENELGDGVDVAGEMDVSHSSTDAAAAATLPLVEPKFIISIDESFEKTVAKQLVPQERGATRGASRAVPEEPVERRIESLDEGSLLFDDSFEVSEAEIAALSEDKVGVERVPEGMKGEDDSTTGGGGQEQPMAVVPPMTINVGEDSDDDSTGDIRKAFSKRVRRPPPDPFMDTSLDKELLAMEDEVIVSPGTNEVCRYWPNCDRGSSCLYKHPVSSPVPSSVTPPTSAAPTSIPCKYMPNCPYGSRCHFQHPPCKFGDYCTNQRCLYKHENSERQPTRFSDRTRLPHQTMLPPKPPPASLTICRYHPHCKNPRCPYNHPKMATGSALKWKKPAMT